MDVPSSHTFVGRPKMRRNPWLAMATRPHYLDPLAAYLRVRESVRVRGVLMPARRRPTIWVSPASLDLLAAPPGELDPLRMGDVPDAPVVGLSSISPMMALASDFDPKKLIKTLRPLWTHYYSIPYRGLNLSHLNRAQIYVVPLEAISASSILEPVVDPARPD